ncbi:hypothetical protein QBC41DRAFT_324935 [Cercophora samala]|uniref:Uncharacterized protein n=1 Tax=Cercophora samala TaxID=330535 RepID=A0AA40DAZ6_9PEZI|nr:hypothetical protein QBC41DRAFT_324935 [Cercophora samala]
MPPKQARLVNFDHFLKCQSTLDKGPAKTHEHICYMDIRNKRRTSLKHQWHHCMLPCLERTKANQRTNKCGLKSIEAAKAYVKHPVLGKRLGYMAGLLIKGLNEKASRPDVVMLMTGQPKAGGWRTNPGISLNRLWSCVTLFDHVLREKRVEGPGMSRDVFEKILDRWFEGYKEPDTVRALQRPENQIELQSEAEEEEETHLDSTILDDSDDADDAGDAGDDGIRHHISQVDGAEDDSQVDDGDDGDDGDDADGGDDEDGDEGGPKARKRRSREAEGPEAGPGRDRKRRRAR